MESQSVPKALTVALVMLWASLASAQQGVDHTSLVRAIKDNVLAIGIDLNHGPGECGRFEVTKRVAWVLREEGIGLIAKFGGQNGCSATNTLAEPKYAVDALQYRDGTVVDILGGGPDGPNTAHWYISMGNPALWRAPINPVIDVPPSPPVDPPPTPTPELGQILSTTLDTRNRTIDIQSRLDILRDEVIVARQELAVARGDLNIVKEDVRTMKDRLAKAGKFLLTYIAPSLATCMATEDCRRALTW